MLVNLCQYLIAHHTTSKPYPLLENYLMIGKKELGVDKIELLSASVIYPERVVNPESKSVEYKGKKIYFWSSSAIRRWSRDPDKYFKSGSRISTLQISLKFSF